MAVASDSTNANKPRPLPGSKSYLAQVKGPENSTGSHEKHREIGD